MSINSKTRKILSVCFVLACYVGLYFISKDNFNKLKNFQFSDLLFFDGSLLSLCCCLVGANWFLEAVKWQISLIPIEKISLKNSFIGVLKGIPISLFTPNRIGEALGRPTVLKEENRISGAFATVYCGLSQMPIMMLFGVFSCVYFSFSTHGFSKAQFLTSEWFIILGFVLTVIVFLCYFFPEYLIPFVKNRKKTNWVSKLKFFCKYNCREKTMLLLFSFFRYFVYSLQNYFAIVSFGLEINFLEGLASVFLIYALMSFVPRPALLELGVRCSASVAILSRYTSDFTIPTISSVFVWCVNLFFPALIGTALYLFEKKGKKT